jgi:hypothetical protein
LEFFDQDEFAIPQKLEKFFKDFLVQKGLSRVYI